MELKNVNRQKNPKIFLYKIISLTESQYVFGIPYYETLMLIFFMNDDGDTYTFSYTRAVKHVKCDSSDRMTQILLHLIPQQTTTKS